MLTAAAQSSQMGPHTPVIPPPICRTNNRPSQHISGSKQAESQEQTHKHVSGACGSLHYLWVAAAAVKALSKCTELVAVPSLVEHHAVVASPHVKKPDTIVQHSAKMRILCTSNQCLVAHNSAFLPGNQLTGSYLAHQLANVFDASILHDA